MIIKFNQRNSLHQTQLHYVESRKCLVFSALKRPTISTHFQRPSEGVDKCNLGSRQAAAKKLMAFQTTKGVTAATHT
jgi:hypothetical protein